MSVMTPADLRAGGPRVDMRGRPIGPVQQAPASATPTTAAVLQQLAPSAPTTTTPGMSASSPVSGTFQRGGQVSQRPGMGAALTDSAVSTGADIAATAAGAVNPVVMGTEYLGGKLKPKEELPTFGANDEWRDLVSGYGRRFEGAGPGIKGGAVRGAGYGSFAGPIGAGVGAAAGAIVGAATRNATSAFSDFRVEDAADAIRKQYEAVLGRTPNEDEIMGQLVGQGWDPTGGDRWVGEKGLFHILGTIRDSEEAKRFAAGGATPAGADEGRATITDPGRTPTMRDAAAILAGEAPAAAPAGGGRLEGFDADKLASGHDSPKYRVGRILQKYPSTPAGLQQALAEINALGLGTASIGGSKGDRLIFSGHVDPRFNGITEFDVIRGAGNGGEAWQWLDPNAQDAGGGQDALLAALGGAGGTPTAGEPTDASSLPGVVQAIQALLGRQGAGSQGGYTDALLRELNATA